MGAEVLIFGSVLEDVIDGGEDGSGDGHDCLPCSTPRLDAVELSAQIAVLFADGRPGRLDQRGFQPGRTLAQAVGSALACALIVARTDAGPGDEMAVGGEATHVEPDFVEPDLRIQSFDARGVEIERLTAARKGAISASTCRSIVRMAASSAWICLRCRRSRKRWFLVTRPRRASRSCAGEALSRGPAKRASLSGSASPAMSASTI